MSIFRQFPLADTLEFPRQGDAREFVLMAIEGHPPERQRKIIHEAVAAGIINEQDRDIFIDAAGLGPI